MTRTAPPVAATRAASSVAHCDLRSTAPRLPRRPSIGALVSRWPISWSSPCLELFPMRRSLLEMAASGTTQLSMGSIHEIACVSRRTFTLVPFGLPSYHLARAWTARFQQECKLLQYTSEGGIGPVIECLRRCVFCLATLHLLPLHTSRPRPVGRVCKRRLAFYAALR